MTDSYSMKQGILLIRKIYSWVEAASMISPRQLSGDVMITCDHEILSLDILRVTKRRTAVRDPINSSSRSSPISIDKNRSLYSQK